MVGGSGKSVVCLARSLTPARGARFVEAGVCVCAYRRAERLGSVFPPRPFSLCPNAPPFGWVSLAARSSGRRSALGRHRPERRDGGGGVGRETQKKTKRAASGTSPPFFLSYRRSRRLRVSRNRLLAGGRGRLAAAAGGFQLEGGEGMGDGGIGRTKKVTRARHPVPPRPSPAYLVLVGGSELDARGAQAEHPRRGGEQKERRA